jgi:hypothetical protein
MAQAGMKLTWSPASNVYLHGDTADIPTALSARSDGGAGAGLVDRREPQIKIDYLADISVFAGGRGPFQPGLWLLCDRSCCLLSHSSAKRISSSMFYDVPIENRARP